MTATITSPTLLSKTVSTAAGVTHIDLNFSAAMAKGRGTIFVTDGAVQTVIDRVTGEPKLRVVGATVTKEIPLSQVTIDGTHVSFDAAGLAAGKHYSIYMGAGTLSSAAGAFAGYTVPNQVAFDTPSGATLPPAITASFAFEHNTLKAGQDIEALVTLSRSVSGLNADAFSAENAAVKSVTATENPLVWKVVLTGSASVADAENTLSLDLGRVEIGAGVHGSGTATSPNYVVDTLVAPWISKAASALDTGVSASDNLVNHHLPSLSGELHGVLAAGDTIELFINGAPADPNRINVSPAATPVTWSYAPGEGYGGPWLEDGANTIVVRVKNGAHTSADYTTTITVDATNPVVTASPEGASSLSLNEDFTISFSEKLYWQPGAGDGTTMPISLYCIEDDTSQDIYVDTAAFAAGSATLTLSPALLGLDQGKHYQIDLPGYLKDKAGNSLSDSPITFKTSGPANATHALVDGKLAYKAGDKITFRIQFDEEVRPASDAILSLGLSNGKRAQIQSVDGDEWTFAYTVAAGAGEDTSNLTINDFSLLVDNIEDLEDFPLTGAHILIDGIHQYAGAGYGYLPVTIEVDTIAPAAPGAPALASGSDSGTLGDNSTNVARPTLTGSGETGAEVSIYEGGTRLGVDRAESGNWSIQLDSNLAPGLHNLTVVQTDRAGNVSSSTSYALTIEAAVQSLAAPVLANDTGSSAVDRITSDTTLKGSGALANASIKIMSGGEIVGAGSADASGNWTAVFGSSLPDGEHSYTVRQVDGDGHMSADSPAISFTVDRSAPAAPAFALDADSDTGVSSSDGLTRDTTPTFHGSGAEAGATIVLYDGVREIGRDTVNGSGNWSVTVAEADRFTVDGSYALTARQVDKAGNTSDASSPMTLRIDTTRPMLTGFDNDRSLKVFKLSFNEQIVFDTNGEFKLMRSDEEVRVYRGSDAANWSIASAAGTSTLTLNIGMNGTFKLYMDDGDTIQDAAGNLAQITGTPIWDIINDL